MIDLINILLLQAPVPGAHNRRVAKTSAIPPLGLGYIASLLLQHDFNVRIIDMDIEDIDVEELQTLLSEFNPAVVGISTTTLTFKNGLRVAKVAKQASPESLICMGGPHVTVCFAEPLKYLFVDTVIRGEGEFTFLEVCKAVANGKIPPFDIPGTVWKEGLGKATSKSPRINELDILPFPARHLMRLPLYNIPGTILTSRGCPFACGFCAGPTVLGKIYTARKPVNVVSEVQTCIDLFGLTSFYFVDDTITHNPKRLQEICEGLRRITIPNQLGRRLKWTCESRADVVSPEMLADMRSAGCTTIQFGMESGSQSLLDHLGKKVTLKQIEQAVSWSRREGISPVLSMVFPHPEETDETLQQTFHFIRRLYDLGAEKIVPAFLTLFPGTRYMDERMQLGLELLTEDTDEYNLGAPTLTTRNFDYNRISNGYSQLLLLTQTLGGSEIGGISVMEEHS